MNRRHFKPRPKFHAYQSRDAILRKLGFSNYAAYLQSPLWSGIRQRVLVRDNHVCKICKRPATQAHHTRYSVHDLNGHTLRRIIAVCGGCHYRLEFEEKEKGTLREANRKYSHSWFGKVQYAKEMTHREQHDSDGLSDGEGFWPGLRWA